jgi:hypothetical protein
MGNGQPDTQGTPPSTPQTPQSAPSRPAAPATPSQTITVVQVVEKPTRETSVGDILLGSVGLVGFVLLAAVLVGLLAGWAFIVFKRLRPDNRFNGQTAEEISMKLNVR